MSSINLLPKSFNFDDKKDQNNGSKFAILISLIMVLIPVMLYTVLHFKNINHFKAIDGLNSEVETINEEIKKKIENNKLLMVEDKAADANSLLANHPYFTKVIDLINENLIADLYPASMIIDFNKQELITVEFEAVAKNNATIASQILVFKNMVEIKDVIVDSIIPTKEGYKEFNVKLEIEKQIIFYKELSDEEKLIKNCEEAEEEIKKGDSIIKIKVEGFCYLAEAIKAGKADICGELKIDYNRCSCNAIVNFLSTKSDEEKEGIIGETETSYYKTSKRILAEPVLKEVINSSCVVKDEEIIAWCNSTENKDGTESCYLLAAVDNERKSICNEIENSCYQCSCNTLLDFLSAKSDKEKEEIIGDRERPLRWIVDDIFGNHEIIDTVNNLCEDICQD